MGNLPLMLGGVTVCNVDLKNYSTVGVGCSANAVFPKNQNELVSVIKDITLKNIPFTVIGKGSNVVFSDNKVDGVIVFMQNINDVIKCDGYVRAYSGASLQKLVRFYYQNNFGGMERLVGIPALVGGAIIMNAGAFGKNIGETLLSVGIIDNNKFIVLDKKDCGFCYRNSQMPNNAVVLYADFGYTFNENAKAQTLEFLNRRIQKQPKGKSFGSTFKNPNGLFAGELIDKAGLKGYRMGGAKVSEKHANFIINDGTATASDIKLLIKYIKEKVYGLFGVLLEEEVRFIGEFN